MKHDVISPALARATDAPALDPEAVVVLRHGNTEVRRLLNALSVGFERVTVLPFIGLSFRPGQLDPSVRDLANLTSSRLGRSERFPTLRNIFMDMQYSWITQKLKALRAGTLIVWNGNKGERVLLCHAARALGMKIIFCEETPFSQRLSIDFNGVNYSNSLPRDTAFYLAWARDHAVDQNVIETLRAQMVARAPRKGSAVRQDRPAADLGNQRYIFCPLQVPGDSQLTMYGGWIKSIDLLIDLLADAARRLPEGWSLRIKEHPSSPFSYADKLKNIATNKFVVDNASDTFAQVKEAHAVLTVNSSVGIQSFLYNKPVITLGQAFYAFDDLTHQAGDAETLAALLEQPEALTFDKEARRAFLSYLVDAHFPTRDDVAQGAFSVSEVIQRDAARDSVMAQIAAA